MNKNEMLAGDELLSIIRSLEGVLCDPHGRCCIEVSDGDRKIIDDSLSALRRLYLCGDRGSNPPHEIPEKQGEWARPERLDARKYSLSEIRRMRNAVLMLNLTDHGYDEAKMTMKVEAQLQTYMASFIDPEELAKQAEEHLYKLWGPPITPTRRMD